LSAAPPEERAKRGHKKRSLLPPLLVATAVAGAVVLLLLRLRMEPPTVPVYALAATDAGGQALRTGEKFRLDLAPAGEVTGAVGARGFLLRGDEVRPWDPPFEVARDGSIHLDGPVEALFAGVPAGEWDVAVAVGRPETLPTAPRDILRARDGGPAEAAWRLVREHVVLGG
jgi:hypothetical protein